MVTKDTLIKDIEKTMPESESVLRAYGLGHLGTLLAFYDTLGESASAYGVDPEILVAAINTKLG